MSLTLLASELSTRGGVQSYMWHLLEALAHPGPPQGVPQGLPQGLPPRLHTLISYADSDALLADPRLQAFTDAGLRTRVCHRSKPGFAWAALRTVRQGDFVIVGHPGQAPVAHGLKRLGRIRGYAVCLHGIEAWGPMAPTVQQALRAADRVIVTTPYTAMECSAFNRVPLSRFHTIALSAGQTVAPSDSDFALAGSFKVLFVARQDKADHYKQFHLAFEAVRTLRQTGVPVTLHMVGTGDNHHGLQQQAKDLMQGLPDAEQAIVFHGRLNDAELSAAYAQCDVFLMPSLKEGFGIVFLEAMRCGKPCIGGWQGGTPYVIEDGQTGYLIPAGDTARLVRCLTDLARQPDLRERLGRAGQQRYEAEFTFERFRDGWLKFLGGIG